MNPDAGPEATTVDQALGAELAGLLWPMHILGGNESCYRPSWWGPNLCNSSLPEFAGKLDFGCAGATSAIDKPTGSFTGVARKAWVSPTCGPLSTVAIPAICPRSLIWLAMVA